MLETAVSIEAPWPDTTDWEALAQRAATAALERTMHGDWLTLPVTILTLGLFIFVINGLLFWAVGSFMPGFHVDGFWSGVFGAIVYSLISWALSSLLMPEPKE